MKQLGTIKLEARIEVLNGLAIGGGKEDIEIGGLDNQVIKDPRDGKPYIPGSRGCGKTAFREIKITGMKTGEYNDTAALIASIA